MIISLPKVLEGTCETNEGQELRLDSREMHRYRYRFTVNCHELDLQNDLRI